MLQNIAPGSKAWGTIQEVTTKRLVVSLPSGLRGYVAPEEASDVLRSLLSASASSDDKALKKIAHGDVPLLTDLFYPGQFVRTVVLSVDDGEAKTAAAGDAAKKGKPVRHFVSQ
jgi:rRNA biogenesis protein RRP5